MFRFFALMWNQDDALSAEAAEEATTALLHLSRRWMTATNLPGFRVIVCEDPGSPYRARLLPGNKGVVLGALFKGTAADPLRHSLQVRTIEVGAATAMCESHGLSLVRDYWGDYVAIIQDPRSRTRWVVKDPTGELPCLHASHANVHFVFSSFADLVRLKRPSIAINWSYVTDRIGGGAFDMEHSPVSGVTQVNRGEAIGIVHKESLHIASRKILWNPLQFTDKTQQFKESDAPAVSQLLHDTVYGCTRAYAENYQNALLRLSGGLDSSIVLASLRHSIERLTAYTYFNPYGKSDERRWARMAAQRASCRHIEVAFDPSRTDLSRMANVVPTVEPAPTTAYLERGPVERRLAREVGCAALFSGDGGDAMFGAECIGLAAEDYVRINGPRIGMLRIAERVASFRDKTIWTVLARIAHRSLFGSRTKRYIFPLVGYQKLVAPHVKKTLLDSGNYPHTWFRERRDIPWETIHKLGILVLYPQLFYDPLIDPDDFTPDHIAPLFAQPVVELCLRVPIHVHFLNGVERGLARKAFQEDLPEAIVRRQWKDRAPESMQSTKARNEAFLKSTMIGGMLWERNLVHREALERMFSATAIQDETSLGELFALLDVEIWLRTLTRHIEMKSTALVDSPPLVPFTAGWVTA